jgi:hypothetical protein
MMKSLFHSDASAVYFDNHLAVEIEGVPRDQIHGMTWCGRVGFQLVVEGSLAYGEA